MTKHISKEYKAEIELSHTGYEEKKKYEGSIYGRIYGYIEGNRCYFLIAVICALISGAVHPCSALFLANVVNEQFAIEQNVMNLNNGVAGIT